MKELHILAKGQSTIPSCKQHFNVSYSKYGNGVIELTRFGEYSLTTSGITDVAARRTAEYKSAYNRVTMDMLHAYEAENRNYTSIHHNIPKIEDVAVYKKELMNLTPKKYTRHKFELPKPIKSEVEDDLRNEVKYINFNDENVSEKEYIKESLNKLTEYRQQYWQEANELFEQIEDAKEERENKKYFTEYKREYNQKEEYINGEEDIVKEGINALCSTIEIPYNISISYTYNKVKHLLSVEMTFENGINVPVSKATILTSGKISIKNKLVKEIIQDKTKSIISCAYYMAGKYFNVSPNILYIRMSIYDTNKQNPLLWVEFERDKLSKLRPLLTDIISDILGYPHVLNYKTKGDALELAIMNKTTFNNEVMFEISKLNSSRVSVESIITDLDADYIALSFNEAQRLINVPRLSEAIKKALSIAKDNGSTYITLSKQYKGIIEEFYKNK